MISGFEVTSLAQAESINTNGIYQVGNLQKTVIIKNPVSHDDLIFGVLMPLSAVFQLYSDFFYNSVYT
jgi:hypothetical protein